MFQSFAYFALMFFMLACMCQPAWAEWRCDGKTGLSEPAPVCSREEPCHEILPTYTYLKPPVTVIDYPDPGPPYCGTGARGKRLGRPVYFDGEARTLRTSLDDMTRYYCQFRPPESQGVLPLVVFVHGSGGYGGSMYDSTSLRAKAEYFNLSEDPDKSGFILVALQSRHLHWPTKDPQSGAKFDSYFRNYSANPDVEYLDKVIDELVRGGGVDKKRIYLMGWSNGARFTSFYGLHRHHTPTPGGNYVAAIANFSGGDPFQNIRYGHEPSCQLASYPQSRIPFYMISRSCDGVACSAEQEKQFSSDDKGHTPGNAAGPWIETLRGEIQNPNVKWQRINYYGKAVDYCTPAALCKRITAFLGHLHWPDGHEDKSGRDWEPEFLNFLKSHPLRDGR